MPRKRVEHGPDPIDGLSTEQLAYLAGLIDGEGALMIVRMGGPRRVYPTIVIAMTHRGVIEWVSALLGLGTVKLNNHTNLARGRNCKPQYKVSIHGARAMRLCAALLPYFKVKADQARVLLRFPPDARLGPGAGLSAENVALREALRQEIRRLNHRGKDAA